MYVPESCQKSAKEGCKIEPTLLCYNTNPQKTSLKKKCILLQDMKSNKK